MSRWYILIVPKKIGRALLVLVCCVLLLILFNSEPLGLYTLGLLEQDLIYDIMLDPGHGGIDPGAIGKGDLYEKHYVLDIVLQMNKILSEQGLKVGLTRDHDRDVSHLTKEGTRHRRDLLSRFKLMHQAKMGLSVHANATKSTKEMGAIVFYQQGNYIDRLYGEVVLEELEKVQILNNSQPIPKTNLLLLKAEPPVLLVEVGFMSNPEDLARLNNPQFRTSVAHALSEGVLKFYQWRFGEQSEP